MKTEGVLIIDTGEILSRDGKQITPAEDLVKPGDYIVAFNQQKVSCKKELIKDLKKTDGKEVSLTLNRQGKKIKVSLMPVEDQTGDYKLGIWVRDDTQGIGTPDLCGTQQEITEHWDMESVMWILENYCLLQAVPYTKPRYWAFRREVKAILVNCLD